MGKMPMRRTGETPVIQTTNGSRQGCLHHNQPARKKVAHEISKRKIFLDYFGEFGIILFVGGGAIASADTCDFLGNSGFFEHYKKKELKMAYLITDKCTMCGACKDVCPVECIAEGDPKYVIDADECIDCGACAGECPVDAIEEGS